MSRPMYERIFYEMPDVSVRLMEESHKRLVEVLYEAYGYGEDDKKVHLSYKAIKKDTGISTDVIRHFVNENHIRMSKLKILCEALRDYFDYKTIIKSSDEYENYLYSIHKK